MAFDLAESEFGVTKLLDPEDLDVGQPDEKSVITYISSLFDALPRIQSYNNDQQKEKEKRGLIQEYSMLYKNLTRWLNESIKKMDNKTKLPNDYVELKSLIADLKSFRLESYSDKQKDNNKIHKIYKELHNNYANKQLNPEEDILILDRLWEKLDQLVHSRETQLELAISKYDKMQKAYDRLNNQTNKLTKNLNQIKDQINQLYSTMEKRISSSTHPSSQILTEFQTSLDTIRKSINQNEKEIRTCLVDAHRLKEERHPNVHLLIHSLKNLEQLTIDLLVTINSPIKLVNKKSSNKVFDNKSPRTQSPINQTILNNTSISITSSLTSSGNSSASSSSNIHDQRTTCSKISSKSFESISVNPVSNADSSANSSLLLNTNNTSPTYSTSSSTSSSISISNTVNTNTNVTSATTSTKKNNTSIDSLNSKSSSTHTLSSSVKTTIETQLNDLIHDAFKWIRYRQNELNAIQYSPDVSMNEIELTRLRQLAGDVKKFQHELEKIELLKMDHAETSDLNAKLDDLFAMFNNLCKHLNMAQQNMDSLIEFNKLIQDELRYLSEMEDIELNRDWSQPRKLKSTDLIQHKLSVEMTLNHKKSKVSYIINFAERLIESNHPASDDLKAYTTTLKNETLWLQKLIDLLGMHTSHLQEYEKFLTKYTELNNYLNESDEKFQELILNINKNLNEDTTNQFNIFKHNLQKVSQCQQQIDNLIDYSNKIPSFKMRKMNIKEPFDLVELQIDYSLVDLKLNKGELCKIEDNSNQIKWKVLAVEKNKNLFVPSVCFVLKGPDYELVEMIDKIQFKHDQLNDYVNRFDKKIKKENMSNMMKRILKDSQSHKFLSLVNKSKIENLIQNMREEVESIVSTSQTIGSYSSPTSNKSRKLSFNNSLDDCSNLVSEFNNFDETLKKLLNSSSQNSSSNNNNKSDTQKGRPFFKCQMYLLFF
jgi:hypothetical protein